ncbi:hypothetical protein WS90_08585, partial [Burkholderia cepacia]
MKVVMLFLQCQPVLHRLLPKCQGLMMELEPFIRRIAQAHREHDVGDRVLSFDALQPTPALVEVLARPLAGHLDHAVAQALAHFARLRFSVGANQPTTMLGSGVDDRGDALRRFAGAGQGRDGMLRWGAGLDQVEQLHRVAAAVAVSVVVDKGPALPVGKVGVAVDLRACTIEVDEGRRARVE